MLNWMWRVAPQDERLFILLWYADWYVLFGWMAKVVLLTVSCYLFLLNLKSWAPTKCSTNSNVDRWLFSVLVRPTFLLCMDLRVISWLPTATERWDGLFFSTAQSFETWWGGCPFIRNQTKLGAWHFEFGVYDILAGDSTIQERFHDVIWSAKLSGQCGLRLAILFRAARFASSAIVAPNPSSTWTLTGH